MEEVGNTRIELEAVQDVPSHLLQPLLDNDLNVGSGALPSVPAAKSAKEDYDIGQTLSIFLFVSIYLIGQGLGSIIFPPYSEAFGRKKLYVASTALYSIFSVIVAAVPSLVALAIGRFITGFLSGIPTVIVAGSIEDMFTSGNRIWLIFLWAVAANIGIIVGPIMGIYIADGLGWKWVFYVAAIVTGGVTVLLLGTRESRPSQLLERRVASLRTATGDNTLRALNPDKTPDLRTFAKLSLFRPLQLLFTEPIVFVVSVMSATAFALIYLFTEALPIVYADFGFSDKQASLPFLAAAVGVLCSVFTRIYDYRVFLSRRRQRRSLAPEDKLFGLLLGAPALAAGLWWFAWTIPPAVMHIDWFVSVVALIPVGYALNEMDTILGGYLVDSYTIYAASAWASSALARTLLCATFPLFAQQMFTNLTSNVAASVLAAIATLFCIAPPLFKRYGLQIRLKNKFARESVKFSSGTRGGDEFQD
ncbi:MAG: hypothetical protein Q9163_003116 [Psora crenata]